MLKIFKKYRQLIVGICIGSMLFGGVSFAATTIKQATMTTKMIKINGIDNNIEMANIEGYNYCKLRDVISAMGVFMLNYDSSSDTISIESDIVTDTDTTVPKTTTPEPTVTADTTSTIPDYFSKITLDEGQEVVYYNDAWCIKWNDNYYMENDDITKQYRDDGIVYTSRFAQMVNDTPSEIVIYRNKNLEKARNDTNIPEGSYYYELWSSKFRAMKFYTSNPDNYIKFEDSSKHRYEFYNLKYIQELLSYTE